MDVLVSLGTNAAYVYSVISAVHRRALYQQGIHIDNMGFFETSALLITFISLGKYLEAHAKGRTSQVSSSAHGQRDLNLCYGPAHLKPTECKLLHNGVSEPLYAWS